MSNENQSERKPLMNKLEPNQRTRSTNAFHHEATEWSKTGRDLVQFFMNIIGWILGD